MNRIGTIFRFTFCGYVRKKSFIISTIIMVIVVVAMTAVPAIVMRVQSGQKVGTSMNTKSVLYLCDKTSGSLDPAVVQKALPDYTIKSIPVDQADAVQRSVLAGSDGEGDVLAVFQEKPSGTSSITTPSFAYYAKSKNSGIDPSKLAEIFRDMRAESILHRSGVTSMEAANILQNVTYQTQTGDHSDNMSGFIPAIAVCILLFIMITLYGYGVAMSIASEKTSRVLEILITSTKPSRIIIGKSLAMGAVGFLQLALVLLAGGISYCAMGNGGISFISFSGFTPGHVVLLLTYFVLGFALYAMLNAVAGASVSNADDVRSAVQPVSILCVISFYLAYGSFMAPGTPLSLVASLIPFSAPFSMPARLMLAGVPWWQIVLSLLLLAGSTCVLAALSIRLYAAAVLHYGRRLKLSDLFRMAKQTR